LLEHSSVSAGNRRMNQDRPLLAGRYGLQRPLRSAAGADRFFAVDTTTGKRVVVAFVSAERKATLEPGCGIKHRHLAGIVDVLDELDPAALPGEDSLPPAT